MAFDDENNYPSEWIRTVGTQTTAAIAIKATPGVGKRIRVEQIIVSVEDSVTVFNFLYKHGTTELFGPINLDGPNTEAKNFVSTDSLHVQLPENTALNLDVAQTGAGNWTIETKIRVTG